MEIFNYVKNTNLLYIHIIFDVYDKFKEETKLKFNDCWQEEMNSCKARDQM